MDIAQYFPLINRLLQYFLPYLCYFLFAIMSNKIPKYTKSAIIINKETKPPINVEKDLFPLYVNIIFWVNKSHSLIEFFVVAISLEIYVLNPILKLNSSILIYSNINKFLSIQIALNLLKLFP